MTTLIYQCENYLSPPLDTPLYIQKKNQVNRWRNEGNLVFSIWRKASKWPKCVAEILAFKDSD